MITRSFLIITLAYLFLKLKHILEYSKFYTDCGTPPPLTNGAVDHSGGTTYTQTATYTCDPGYDLNGALFITCQADGTWDDVAPVCDKKSK